MHLLLNAFEKVRSQINQIKEVMLSQVNKKLGYHLEPLEGMLLANL